MKAKKPRLQKQSLTAFRHFMSQYRSSTLLLALNDSGDIDTINRMEEKQSICNKMSKVDIEQQSTYRAQLRALGTDDEFILAHPKLNNFMSMDNQTILNNPLTSKVFLNLSFLKLLGIIQRYAHKWGFINNIATPKFMAELKRDTPCLSGLVIAWSDGSAQLAPGITDPHSYGGSGWSQLDITEYEGMLEDLYLIYCKVVERINESSLAELEKKPIHHVV